MSASKAASHRIRVDHGFTLIELLIIIVVLGIAGATLTVVSTRGAEMSARMLRDQQALSLATAVLAEVKSMPFTYCDPNDANYLTATLPTGCASLFETPLTFEPNELRLGATATTRFDNVSDYNNLSLSGATLTDASGVLISTVLPTLAGCTARVTESNQAFSGIAATDVILIRVTVTCPDQIAPVVVEGLRVRYAPNN